MVEQQLAASSPNALFQQALLDLVSLGARGDKNAENCGEENGKGSETERRADERNEKQKEQQRQEEGTDRAEEQEDEGGQQRHQQSQPRMMDFVVETQREFQRICSQLGTPRSPDLELAPPGPSAVQPHQRPALGQQTPPPPTLGTANLDSVSAGLIPGASATAAVNPFQHHMVQLSPFLLALHQQQQQHPHPLLPHFGMDPAAAAAAATLFGCNQALLQHNPVKAAAAFTFDSAAPPQSAKAVKEDAKEEGNIEEEAEEDGEKSESAVAMEPEDLSIR